MKKRRILAAVLAIVLVLILMTGCGSSSSSYAAMDTAKGEYYPAEAPSAAEAENGFGAMDAGETASTTGNAPTGKTNTKLIYTAYLSLETTEFDSVSASLNTLVESMGGYYEENNVDNYGSYRHGYYTVRVPAENFSAFCTQAGTLCNLTNISQSANDVSEEYYDMESRLTTQQTKLERLQTLLSQAENMEDIITIESAISETELQIEQLTGSLRHYDSLVGYSTITVSLDEVYKLSTVEEPVIGFGAKLSSAFKSGCSSFVNGLQSLLLSIARNWAGLLIFLVIVAVVVLIIVRASRKKKLENIRLEEKRAAIAAQRAAESTEKERKKD